MNGRPGHRLSGRLACLFAVATLSSLLFASTALASSQRVPFVFFGINLDDPYSMTSQVRENHLNSMQAARITEVRLPIPWQMIEPNPPNGTNHTYRWDLTDPVVASLAQHGIRSQAMIAYAPAWASNATPEQAQACRQGGAVGLANGAPKQYALAANAVAKRYGRNGSFWAANPTVPYNPVVFYEIWNAPNTAGTSCPKVDPEGYGITFGLATAEIRKFDPQAFTIVGGMGIGAQTQGGSVKTSDFLIRMVRGMPSIKNLPNIMIGAHIYPGKALSNQLKDLPTFRGWMRTAGFPNTVPMTINEIGFSRVGALDFTEPERVAAYRNTIGQIPRTNCNIGGVLPYTWTTREQDINNPEHWFGIAQPGSGTLYPSGTEYVAQQDLFLGRLPQEAPRQTVMLCPGMPLPDTDKDGVVDQNDNFPLNASKT